MKYLEIFIKESQRMIPAVSLIGRHATENITLCKLNNICESYSISIFNFYIASGKIIPKGSSVGILLYAMGHNPKTFEDPMVFNPDRFLPVNRENKNPYEYIPFSAGPRNCIGNNFNS